MKRFLLTLTCFISIYSFSQSYSAVFTTTIDIEEDVHVKHKIGTTRNENNYNGINLFSLVNSPGGFNQYFRFFLKADLLGIPANAEITNATLYLFNDGVHSGNNESIMHRVNFDWNEDQVTWNNQPVYEQNAGDPVLPNSTSSNQNYVVDVTSLMQLSVSKGVFNVVVKQVSEIPNCALFFASSEHSDVNKHPYLTISYKVPIVFELTEELTHKFYNVTDNKFWFTYRENNNVNSSLDYEILDSQQNSVSNLPVVNGIKYGNNTVELDLTALSLPTNTFYTLIITKANNRKLYLRFKTTS